jgi:hypothetical protein
VRGIFAELFQTVKTTKEVSLAMVLKRTGGSLFADGHSADGINRLIDGVHFCKGLPVLIFFHPKQLYVCVIVRTPRKDFPPSVGI